MLFLLDSQSVSGGHPDAPVAASLAASTAAPASGISPAAPPAASSASLISLQGGVSGRVKVEKAAVHLTWQPGPTADTKHTYTAQASTDGGQTWYTLGVGLTEPSIQIDKGQFEAGREVRLRVLATDGFTQLVVASEKFTA